MLLTLDLPLFVFKLQFIGKKRERLLDLIPFWQKFYLYYDTTWKKKDFKEQFIFQVQFKVQNNKNKFTEGYRDDHLKVKL